MQTDAELAAQVMQRIDALAQISDEPDRLTRTYGSPAMRRANDLVASWMREAGMTTEEDVIGFADEEGVRFRSTYLGSRVLADTFDFADLKRADADHVSLREAVLRYA